MRTLSLVAALFVCASARPVHAADTYRFKPGAIELMAFLEQVSGILEIGLDASAVEGGPIVEIPDLGPVSRERAFAMFSSLLYQEGFTWVLDVSTGLYRVMRIRDARDQELPWIEDADLLPDSDQVVTYAMKLRYANPESVARAFRAFMPAYSRIIPESAMGSVLITDVASNLRKMRKLVQHLDTPEAAREFSREVAQHLDARTQGSKDCDAPWGNPSGLGTPGTGWWVALFSLIAAVIGFLSRGYVIRRIEGGL